MEAVAPHEVEALSRRVATSVRAAISTLQCGASNDQLRQMLQSFSRVYAGPFALRGTGMNELLASVDLWRGIGNNDPERHESERLLLLYAIQQLLGQDGNTHMPGSVRLQTLFQWALTVAPPKRSLELFRRGTPTFEAACETVLSQRIPAGQLAWVRTGLARRAVSGLSPLNAGKLLWGVVRRMGGFKPAYFTHANSFRRNRFIMLELEARRSYVRMADAMRTDRAALGIVTVSWYHDPALPTVSPHLAWMNDIVLEGGGYVIRGRHSHANDGSFENSEARKVAADTGRYRPQEGIVLWPREALLQWADKQRGLNDDVTTAARINEMLEQIDTSARQPDNAVLRHDTQPT